MDPLARAIKERDEKRWNEQKKEDILKDNLWDRIQEFCRMFYGAIRCPPRGKGCPKALQNSRKPVVWLLCGPKCNKKAYLEELRWRYNFYIIRPKKLLEDEVKSNSDLGKLITKIAVSGSLTPRAVLFHVIRKRMCKIYWQCVGWIFVGWPWSAEQAKDFDTLVAEVSMVMVFEVPYGLMKARLDMEYGYDHNQMYAEVRYRELEEWHYRTADIKRIYKDRLVVINVDRFDEKVWKELMDIYDEMLRKLDFIIPTRLD